MKFKRFITLVFLYVPFILTAQNSSLVSGENGMVATAHPLATQVAIEILQEGGNAIDAAVAAAFAIGVVEPDGSGIGGGGGMVVFMNEENKSYYIDYYATSPSKTPNRFEASKSRHTGIPICVPGTVAGLTFAHEKFGSLPLSRLLQPAIRMAEQGFPIDATLGTLILDNTEILGIDKNTAAVFLDGDFPKMEGEILIQKDLAATLKEISEKGRDGFYKGAIAESMVAGIKERGGTVSLKDLENYQVKISDPLYGTYRGFDVLGAQAPQSGASIIQGLNILENVNLEELGHYTENSKTLHIIAETFRKVYTDRYYFIGDPEYSNVPINGIISKDYAKSRFDAINQFYPDPPRYRDTEMGTPAKYEKSKDKVVKSNRQYDFSDEDDDFSFNDFDEFDSWDKNKSSFTLVDSVYEDVEFDGSTTHLSVVDKHGNAVSLTQTLGTFFGSAQTVNGILFNNAMANFSSSDNPNILRKNKTPRSSISPTIILKDGNPYIVIGTPGGSRIIATVLQVIVNIVDFEMNVEEANRAPRFFTQKWEDYLHVESGVGEDIIDELNKMGHSVRVHEGTDLFFGGVQMIFVDPETGKYYGSADIRRGGNAIGY